MLWREFLKKSSVLHGFLVGGGVGGIWLFLRLSLDFVCSCSLDGLPNRDIAGTLFRCSLIGT